MLLVFASVRARIGYAMALALAPLSSFTIASTFAPAWAQTVTPDGTLPTNVIQDAAANQFMVTGGSAQGTNLFHSFDRFSPAEYSVLFNLSADAFGSQIERIFSRVTGASASEINGSLFILGGNAPDLFLLNPNGIIFGPNAKLNLPGSFVGTTAESLQFADGLSFGTTASPFPLLSLSVPTGLQFGQNPGAIAVLGNGHNINDTDGFVPSQQNPAFPVTGLSIAPGHTLALLGGPVRLSGAELQPQYLTLPTGDSVPLGDIHLEIGAVAAGTVQLGQQSQGWDFDYAGIDTYQDIELTNRTWLNGGGLTPGRINLWGRNITIDGGSTVSINNLAGLSGNAPSGLNIRASELLKLQGSPELNSQLSVTTTVNGENSAANARQDAGYLNIFSKNLQILDGANIAKTTFGSGSGGLLTIEVQEDVLLDSQSQTEVPRSTVRNTSLAVATLASGNAGRLEVNAKNIAVKNGALISSLSLSQGDTGRVEVRAREEITVQSVQPSTLVNSTIGTISFNEGSSGDVFLSAKSLNVLDGGVVNSSAFGSGDAGSIEIDVSDSIRVEGVDPITSMLPSVIDASIVVQESPSAEVFAERNGNSGDVGSIKIRTPRLELFDGGQITVNNRGDGNAGDIEIQTDSLVLADQSRIGAITTTGDGGNLILRAREATLLRRGSEISVSSERQGNGGTIRIETPHLIAPAQENSDITANAASGAANIDTSGGRITIDAFSILGLSEQPGLTDQSDITAFSPSGEQFSGTIELTQPNTEPDSGIAALPSGFTNQDPMPIANACVEGGKTQLALRGRGGLPRSPDKLLHDPLLIAREQDSINQAIALRNRGFYAQALAHLQKEVEKSEAGVALERQAIALRQLGITQNLLEQHDASQGTLERSLAIAQDLGNPEQISATLLSLGNLARAMDKQSQARSHYQQALEQNPSSQLKARILANQLSLALAEGEQGIAQSLTDRLLAELSGSSNPQYIETRLNVAATAFRHQQSELIPNFRAFLQQNLEAAKAEGEPQAIAYALGHLGQAHEQAQQWEKAQQFSEAALKLAQSQQDIFQEYQWSWQLGRISYARWQAFGDEQWRSQAQFAYQLAVQSLQQLRGDLANVSPTLQFSFRNRVEPIYRRYVSLLLAASRSSQSQPSTSKLKQALETIEALRLAELDNFFQDACLNTRPQSIEQLDASAAVVYPIILEDRVEVIVSHQGKLKQHTIPVAPQEFEATAQRFQQGLVVRSRRSYQQSGQQLYDWLIHPLLPALEANAIETLVFVPDGPLASIPMAALFDGEEFLIEQFKVAIAPSLQLLPAKRTSAIPTRALVAGITQQTQNFAQLPHVEQEVERVQALFPGERLLNESFTRETLGQSLVESQPPIVHIATHGQFSSKASETFLLAWDEQISIDQLRELLQSRDKQTLSPTELLVLSACETAVGDEFAALGLAGMAVRAGARSTLASLWSVDDESTALLMETFYQQLAQSSTTKSAALRNAQLAMLEHPTYKHPYYWSAFMLMGNWQ